MKSIQLKKFVLANLFFLIYLKNILIKGEFKKPFTKENKLIFPKSISSSSKKSFHLLSNNITGLLNCNIKINTVLNFDITYTQFTDISSYSSFFV